MQRGVLQCYLRDEWTGRLPCQASSTTSELVAVELAPKTLLLSQTPGDVLTLSGSRLYCDYRNTDRVAVLFSQFARKARHAEEAG